MITGMMARRIAGAALIGIDSAQTPASLSLSESDRRYTMTGGAPPAWQRAHCTNPQSSGKRVFEVEIISSGYLSIGLMKSSKSWAMNSGSPEGGDGGLGCAMWTSFRLYIGGGYHISANLLTNTVGHVLRVYADLDTGNIWLARNGALLSGDPEAGTGATYTIPSLGEFEVACGCYESGASGRIALTSAQMSSDPIPAGWEAWA